MNENNNSVSQNGQRNPAAKSKVGAVLDVTIEKMRAMADSSTIIGEKIVVGDGTVLIPVSKVSYGFASGGTDFPSKNPVPGGLFAGGGGGGMTLTPVAFIAVKDGNVQVLNLSAPDNMGAAERAIAMAPELIEKIKSLFGKDKNKETPEG